MRASIEQDITDSIATKQQVLAQIVPEIEKAASTIIEALKNGNKILTCGNGGSAADAQHFAAELTCKYDQRRRALPAIALSTDTSHLTAAGNDYSFDDVFSRGVEALGQKGDVLVAITTSGNSPNVLKAIAAARQKEMSVIGLTGKGGGKMKELPIHRVIVPSNTTARIQESHILIIHTWCRLIDAALAK
jgi:D-sedoheptulose 7-phosphate isomerase